MHSVRWIIDTACFSRFCSNTCGSAGVHSLLARRSSRSSVSSELCVLLGGSRGIEAGVRVKQRKGAGQWGRASGTENCTASGQASLRAVA